MAPFGHTVPVSLATLLFLAAACNTYGPSLLEPGESSSPAGGSSGTSDTSTSGGPPNGSSFASDGGASSTGFDATSSGGATDGAGGSGGSQSAPAGSGGADEAAGSSSETDGGGNAGSAGSGGSTSSGGSAGNGGSGSDDTGGGNSGGSGGGSGDCDAGDCCPDSPDKLAPGQCGCEVPDTDTDADSVADCIDLCPEDAAKSAPGECGCGWRDEDTPAAAGCVALKDALAHRYSFAGEGAEASDSQGDTTAQILGTTLDGSGSVGLGTAEGQYVELPAGMISAFSSVTLELWFAWDGGALWTRLLDFGSTVEGVPGQPGTGESFVLISPNGDPGPAYPYAGFNPPGDATEVSCSGIGALTTGETHHVALSLDTEADTLTLYVDGMLACAKALPFELSVIDDVNCWLGRSQFASDAGFVGSIEEFRIYEVALSASQVALSYQAGPDPPFLTSQTDE